jgi:hypothetical protein
MVEQKQDTEALETSVVKRFKADMDGDIEAMNTELPWKETMIKLSAKRKAQDLYLREIDELLTSVRFQAKLNNMSPTDMLVQKDGTPDEMLGAFSGYMPYARLADQLKFDHRLPGEVRKFLAKTTPEF